VRDGDKRIVRLKEGTPKGRHVVIVDDLVQSGAVAAARCCGCLQWLLGR
jgi:adenine/guanine phosphoribosyltransferase-like PRPP-binding protein